MYKQRPGIALIKLCGAQVLVPTRQATKDCARIRALTVTEIMVWRSLEMDVDRKTLCKACGVFMKRTEEELEQYVEETLRQLCCDGFLIELPDGDDALEER